MLIPEGEGISLMDSENIILRNNTCVENDYTGILLGNSENIILRNNICAQNGRRGISLSYSGNITLGNNLCQENDYGIFIHISNNATVVNNTCIQNRVNGIFLGGSRWGRSGECSIIGNTIIETIYYGISLNDESHYNQIQFNNFINNNNGNTQAFDDGLANVFTNNYWDEWTTPDVNGDRIVDNPYVIDGAAVNQDASPFIVPFTYDGDFDGDGIPNGYEITMGLNLNLNDSADDLDQDNLSNLDEYQLGTHANDPDTDKDGLMDGEEVKVYTTSPLQQDTDVDGLMDTEEVKVYNTDPLDPDSDGDWLTDGDEINIYKTDPLDSDSDNDLFPDGLDYGWWGNPRNRWDNPLIRSILLMLMIGLVGLGLWASFIAVPLPRLKRDLNLLHHHFQQYVQQFQENIIVIKTQENSEEFETAAGQISEAFLSYEDFYSFAQHLVKHKWLRTFLRPELTQWEATFTILQQVYKDFQKTRLKRLDAKY